MTKLKQRNIFPYQYTLVKLLDGTECQILLDTGGSKSIMSKSYYMHCNSLYSLPEFALKHRDFWLRMVSL